MRIRMTWILGRRGPALHAFGQTTTSPVLFLQGFGDELDDRPTSESINEMSDLVCVDTWA